jgi:hypothetical protein
MVYCLFDAIMFILVVSMCGGNASDMYYAETFQSHTKSLGLKLSQDLQILGFAVSSPAQARGVKTGDVLIKVTTEKESEDLEAQGPKGLSKLSSLMRSLAWPRTFHFKRIGAGIDNDQDQDQDQDQDEKEDSTTTTDNRDPVGIGIRTIIERGVAVLQYNAVFPRDERVGIHFDRELGVVGFAHGSHGERYAAEKLNNVKRGDVLSSVNHDKSIVKSLLQKRWPEIAALQLLESLPPPIVLGFSRVMREETSITTQREHMKEANHPIDNDLLQEAHAGDHIDFAVAGAHHNHDAGNVGHHTANTYRIMRAAFGPLPSCVRNPLRVVQPFNACGAITNANQLKGVYALVMRGECNFIDKTRAVQAAGAVGLIVINTDETLIKMPGAQFGMDDLNDVNIPSIMVENRAFDLVQQEMSDGHDGGRSNRWTSRVVLQTGCGKETTNEEEEENEDEIIRQQEASASSTYVVGPHGRALYQHYERAKVHHPITGGLMLVDLGPSHPSPPMRVEYLLSTHGKVFMENSEDDEDVVYPPLQWMSTSEVCNVMFASNNNKNHKNYKKADHHQTFIVTPLTYSSTGTLPLAPSPPPCGAQDIILNIQNAGFGGVVFLTKSVVLVSLDSEVGVKGMWGTSGDGSNGATRRLHRPNDIRIPIMTLSEGDGRRMKHAFEVDKTDGQVDMRCSVYSEREVVRVWQQLNVLKDPAQWPYSYEGRRRLMHRMLKLAAKSASRTEAIVKCAENAEKYYYEEQHNSHDEL